MIKVHVVCGGIYNEREVSLRSGKAVAEALQNAGYDVAILDSDAPLLDLFSCDVIFPVLHGKGGEDGTIQKTYEDNDTKFVGSGSQASEQCFDKPSYKVQLTKSHITTPNGAVLTKEAYQNHALKKQPHVVKPFDGGSSLDNHIVRDPDAYDFDKVFATFDVYGEMLVEELIVGTEITVGILGDTALPVIEIIPPKDAEFDYENKYNGKTQELCPPVHVSKADQELAQELALRIHTMFDCRDLSRTDMIISRSGTLYVLETNTMPGMTNQSLYPRMAATAGLPMEKLVSQLVRYALSR
ncbi:MAG: D-alanine--D-alanine ligase [Candidatus Saccharimonadales bacterium]